MYARFPEIHSSLKGNCFLFGPRQCGKTTILKELEHIRYLDLLSTDEFLKYNQRPGFLFSEVAALPNKTGRIIIDEIQKVPRLLDEVQRCLDKFPNIEFILSGSSARKLKRGGANLLGGRAVNLSLYPLSILELGSDFSLDSVLAFGSLPKISTLISENNISYVKRLLRAYVSIYLAEEIKAEALVRKLDSFQRFLEVSAGQFAQEINLSDLSDQTLVSLNSVKNYYSILEDTLLGFFLYPYSKSIRTQLTKTPKFYFFDNGVTRAIQGTINIEIGNIERGFLFEQFMIQEAIKINSYFQKDLKLNFWKTSQGAEVDLVISRGAKLLLAIEFKASKFPSKRHLSGLKSFKREHPKVNTVLCAPIDQELLLDDEFRVLPPKHILSLLTEL